MGKVSFLCNYGNAQGQLLAHPYRQESFMAKEGRGPHSTVLRALGQGTVSVPSTGDVF
jgi:hypothetical protein